MTRKEVMATIKQSQKDLAQQVREAKVLIHQPHTYRELWAAQRISKDFRYRHIAYCLLRGTDYEKIECPRENNEPDWSLIEEYKTEFEEMFHAAEEAVCSDEK